MVGYELEPPKKKSLKFLYVFIFIYILAPQYYYVFGPVNSVNFISLIFLVFSLVYLHFKVRTIYLFLKSYWIYMLVYSILAFMHVGVVKSLAYLISFLLVSFMLVNIINTSEIFENTIDLIIIAGVVNGIVGVVEAVTKNNLFQSSASHDIEFFYEVRLGILRVMTTFGQPISYCIFQGIVGAIILYRLSHDISDKKKKWLRIAYSIIFISMVISVSRAAIIAFLAVHIAILMKFSFKRFAKAVMILLPIVFTVMIILVVIESKVIATLYNISIMFLSMAFPNMSANYTVEFGKNANLIGNRLSLYAWVIGGTKGNEILGKGTDATFTHRLDAYSTKNSIEVHYLYIYFKHGLMGLITLVMSYISIISVSFKNRKNPRLEIESLFSFNYLIFIVMFVYLLLLFSTQETDITRIFVVLISLLISYNIYEFKETSEEKSDE